MVCYTFVEKMQELHLKKALHTFFKDEIFQIKALPYELEAYELTKGM